MADISQINLPNDSITYDIADLIARGRIWQGTQAQYNALTTIDPDTVYFITDATGTVLATVATTGSYNDLTDKPDLTTKMDKANPTGTGSLSMNRKANSTEGTNSVTFGNDCEATANYSLAEGDSNKATGAGSHAEGYLTIASGNMAHAEGYGTHSVRRSQHVFGEYNEEDTGGAGTTGRGTYVEIVGKGTSDVSRSNARTLDWNGNETLAGDITINGNTSVTQSLGNLKVYRVAFSGTTSASGNINPTGFDYTNNVIIAAMCRDKTSTSTQYLVNVWGGTGIYGGTNTFHITKISDHSAVASTQIEGYYWYVKFT